MNHLDQLFLKVKNVKDLSFFKVKNYFILKRFIHKLDMVTHIMISHNVLMFCLIWFIYLLKIHFGSFAVVIGQWVGDRDRDGIEKDP